MGKSDKATAVATGKTTLTMPFGTPIFARPDSYMVYRDREGRPQSTKAILVTLPLITVVGSINLPLTVYANLNDGRAVPRISWPRGFSTSGSLKDRAVAHVKGHLAKWPDYVRAMGAAGQSILAAASGKAAAVPEGELPEVEITDNDLPAETTPEVTTEATAEPENL